MSVWGKILGGAAGFAMGGPLGALVGVIAGHAVDRYRTQQSDDVDPDAATKRIAFTIAVIVLGAKMAKADGVVTKDEINAFREVFQVPENEIKNVSRVFNQARQDARGFEPYAEQVARMFRNHPRVLEELLNALFHIARADGVYHAKEKEFLHRVSEIFGFDAATFSRIEAEQMGPQKADPYVILGMTREAGDAELKSAYRKLVRENHPDTLVAQGMPQEFIDLANDKLATINGAWDRVSKERGIS
ncbi:MAG: DnaJ domain-containing protein [Alphaproteobacteria bacterium]|nr:DnaJ domain-containing protein [Alphaproteobacteria bacterium]